VIAGSLDVSQDADSHRPVFFSIAVKEGGKVANCKRDVGASGNSKIIQAANKFSVGGMLHPVKDGGIK
jgi:hypothetical protein